MPRDASREPVPVEGGLFGVPDDASGATSNDLRSSSPEPASFQLKEWSLSEFDMSIAFTWSGVACGYFCNSRAAAPAVNAVASDVPLPRKY